MTGAAYTPERGQELIQRIVERLASSRDAAFTSERPLTPGGSTASFTFPSREAGGVPVSVQASPRVVSAHYFSTLGTRVLAGRAFDESDTETSEAVASAAPCGSQPEMSFTYRQLKGRFPFSTATLLVRLNGDPNRRPEIFARLSGMPTMVSGSI
jgi:hypothetical protein